MKTLFHTLVIMLGISSLSGQVLNTSNEQVQVALSNAQVEGSPLANFFQKRTPMMDILNALVKDDDGIVRHYVGAEVGSAYANDDFQPGQVFYNDEKLGDVHYRLNAYNDEIELKKTALDEEKPLALIKNEEVKMVTENGEIVFRTFLDDKNKSNEGYLYVLDEGEKYILYKRLYKKFSEPKPAANSMVSPIPSRFTDYVAYYYQEKEGNQIVEIPLKTNKFLKEFYVDNSKVLKEFMKSNDLDLENETDLVKILQFIAD
ncbi:hypothetical protein [Maribacter aestuarii]|uniref:hypothetical protein n=1 Tax=Maribacter aestuarii TaxID=1130723 RepID=UPI0025A5B98D|nr:hypothetical protein [Maribacter aestuarii]